MSFPYLDSVNDYIDLELTRVKYSHFDNAVSMVRRLKFDTLVGQDDQRIPHVANTNDQEGGSATETYLACFRGVKHVYTQV